ncbi:hypothetical protein ACJJTC_012909 [Scirpophaga incertulas]
MMKVAVNMEKSVNLKLVTKHITEGTIGEHLCRLCLMPLTPGCENIFTKICTMDEEYCIADILSVICDIQISDEDQYMVCCDCFSAAFNAYKFYLNTRKSDNILKNLTDRLLCSLSDIKIPENGSKQSLLISLPEPHSVDGTFKLEYGVKTEQTQVILLNKHNMENLIVDQKTKNGAVNSKVTKIEKDYDKQDDDEELVVIMTESGQPTFLRMLPNGIFVEIEADDQCRNAYKLITERRTRKPGHKGPMSWKNCSRCPIKYRYAAKLRDHMLLEHHIVLYVCKICKAVCEGREDYNFHMNTHSKEYMCDICGINFKKRTSIISHLTLHERMKDTTENHTSFVCTECGFISLELETLNKHMATHSEKPFTCYYCGRMYKKEVGFNNHIRKHEMYLKKGEIPKEHIYSTKLKTENKDKPKQDFTCTVCGKNFLGQRALNWHGRLHTNERPFECEVCGKGFISLNRRNQHTLCAHTAPTRRCPLCPALFHMRSMVNSHIKKVHLNQRKRRRRAVRERHVSWQTAPVPMQELSVAVQHDILELDLGPGLCQLPSLL